MSKIKQNDIDFILKSGEGFKVEFKESPNHIDRAMAAFANAEGGKIYLGLNDRKEVVGLNITNALRSQIQDIARNCDPPVNISLEAFEEILVVEIKEGTNKPYKCKDGFFMRIGPNSQKMSRNEIIDLIVKEGRVFFDDRLNEKVQAQINEIESGNGLTPLGKQLLLNKEETEKQRVQLAELKSQFDEISVKIEELRIKMKARKFVFSGEVYLRQ